jgi:hypothetical protein
MFRRPTHWPDGRQALKKGWEFVRIFNALTEKSPWAAEQNVDVVRNPIKTSGNGSADGSRQDGTRQDARGGGLVATTERLVEDLERLPTPCFVILAPAGKRPRNEQPVTNEGGLIRFALGVSSDRDAGPK